VLIKPTLFCNRLQQPQSQVFSDIAQTTSQHRYF